MTPKPESTKRNIAILGFSNVKIENPNSLLEQFRTENKTPIQFFDAKFVAGKQHLYFAAINALNAFEKKTNISNNLAVETLLYASGQRQIKKAVKMLGITQNTTEIAALIIPKNAQEKQKYIKIVTDTILGKRDDQVLELKDMKISAIKKLFQISKQEFEAKLEKEGLEKEALTDLVIEHMALLVTRS
jgi:KEOPS complex subunit Cgi121